VVAILGGGVVIGVTWAERGGAWYVVALLGGREWKGLAR
jgi:hypothetical protein